MKFFEQIEKFAPSPAEAKSRRWIYVPYDRLHDGVGPLASSEPEDIILVMMESRAKGTRREYHKKKLTLLLSAMRHFALEQGERGCRMVYGYSPTTFADGLLKLQQQWQWSELITNRPAERELRIELREAKAAGLRIRAVTDTAWMSTTEDFERVFGKPAPHAAQQKRQYLMDRFYRAMRQKTGLLMRDGKPVGGKWSYDADNRRPYHGEVPVQQRPSFAPNAVTLEVMEFVERKFPNHFGTLAGFDLPVTRKDAEAAWQFALKELLPHFGPFEDAMHTAHPDLFHSMTSPLINLTLLRAEDVARDVAEAFEAGRIPLASAEGFIRQLIGWREFMRHIHDATDGFRTLTTNLGAPSSPRASGAVRVGDGGENLSLASTDDPRAGAQPNYLNANHPLPPVYWGVPSGMVCMDTVVAGVIANGWSHHITRLMVLSNLATLCGFSPRELTDWFWFAYVDAYDWVVEPNVLGMATFADRGLTATKPYVSGAAYINRMSDFCGKCPLDPKRSLGPGSCPFTAMYWSFLERNEAKLAHLNRMAMPLQTMRKKTESERTALRERAAAALVQLEAGQRVA